MKMYGDRPTAATCGKCFTALRTANPCAMTAGSDGSPFTPFTTVIRSWGRLYATKRVIAEFVRLAPETAAITTPPETPTTTARSTVAATFRCKSTRATFHTARIAGDC